MKLSGRIFSPSWRELLVAGIAMAALIVVLMLVIGCSNFGVCCQTDHCPVTVDARCTSAASLLLKPLLSARRSSDVPRAPEAPDPMTGRHRARPQSGRWQGERALIKICLAQIESSLLHGQADRSFNATAPTHSETVRFGYAFWF
jgi:hypothetical protein